MSVQGRNPATPGVRLFCMCGGTLTFDQSVFNHMQGMGTAIEVPTPIFLIEHPEGKVVFETGLHPAVATNPEEHWGQRARDWKPRMQSNQTVDKQLASLGIHPDEIRYVVLSCLLPDHAGGSNPSLGLRSSCSLGSFKMPGGPIAATCGVTTLESFCQPGTSPFGSCTERIWMSLGMAAWLCSPLRLTLEGSRPLSSDCDGPEQSCYPRGCSPNGPIWKKIS